MKESREAPALENIRVLSSNDLYYMNFRVVGQVSVRDKSKKGFTQDEAVKALKVEAFRNYGSQVNGLINVELVKKEKVFYYRKAARNISAPKDLGTYRRASAEVVIWNARS